MCGVSRGPTCVYIWLIGEGEVRHPCVSLESVWCQVGVPDEYVLVVEATPAPVNTGWTFHVGLASGPSQFVFVVDAPGGIGLDRVDGKPFTANESTRPGGRFTPGAPVTLECTVRNAGVHVTMNGETIVDWRGERSRLSVVPIWPGRAAPGLFISTHGSYQISRIEVRPAGEKE